MRKIDRKSHKNVEKWVKIYLKLSKSWTKFSKKCQKLIKNHEKILKNEWKLTQVLKTWKSIWSRLEASVAKKWATHTWYVYFCRTFRSKAQGSWNLLVGKSFSWIHIAHPIIFTNCKISITEHSLARRILCRIFSFGYFIS